MARKITALNVGSSQICLAEFSYVKGGGIELTNFAVKPIGLDPATETDTSAYVVSTIRDIMRENNIKPGPALVCISGKDVFPRFVKLPPVTPDKVNQIVFYEAQQNVPFPIAEVVWDYQLIENEEGGYSVMLVAVKTDIVKKHTDSVEAAGFEPEIVDVAPMALYNLVRFNYGEIAGCTLVVDIGARSTNLVFIENKKVFSRSIPVAGHSITQELMKEFNIEFKEAEELKMAHAFVAFSGAVENSESPVVNRVAKTVRSVMTRLHAEVSRSISFYRGQQNGNRPTLLLLTGGSAVIPETDTFLREKLGLRVEYLNPFQGISVSSGISSDEVAAKMHLLGEVAGLALRKAFSCPMEINLLPPELVSRTRFKNRLPFFAAAAGALLLALTCWWGYCGRLRLLEKGNLQSVETKLAALQKTQAEIDVLREKRAGTDAKVAGLLNMINLRMRWIEIVSDIRSCLLDGMWLTSIDPIIGSPDGPITHIELKGMGFVDKVKDAEAVGEFGNSLKKMRYFSDEVDVLKVVTASEYGLEFSVRVRLKEPLVF